MRLSRLFLCAWLAAAAAPGVASAFPSARLETRTLRPRSNLQSYGQLEEVEPERKIPWGAITLGLVIAAGFAPLALKYLRRTEKELDDQGAVGRRREREG